MPKSVASEWPSSSFPSSARLSARAFSEEVAVVASVAGNAGSGGIETSGYAYHDTFAGFGGGTNYGGNSNTASSWSASQWTAASNVLTFCGEIFRMSGNTWFCQAAFMQNDSSPNYFNNLRGFKTLSAELTQVRFTRTAGTYDDANSYVRIGYQ